MTTFITTSCFFFAKLSYTVHFGSDGGVAKKWSISIYSLARLTETEKLRLE
jgi:hypothetical protein